MGLQFTKLKMYRLRAGLTQEELAEKVGVSRQAVAKWERGETLPDIETCMKMSELFETTIDILVRSMTAPAEEMTDGKHFLGVSKMNDKGQITLPAECRKMFGLTPGDSILVLGDESKGMALVKIDSNTEGEDKQ